MQNTNDYKVKDNTYLFSNEIVFRGHPDKVCDQISGAILDECLKQDPFTRAGIEVVGGKKKIFITGELTTKAKINIRNIVKRVLSDIGYNYKKYKIIIDLSKQSPDIALGVDNDGAGDQGIIYGYACNDTSKYLPLAMVILKEFAQQYDNLRKLKPYVFLPDGKAQITGVYNKRKLKRINTFVINYQNSEMLRDKTDKVVIALAKKICAKYKITVDRFIVNNSGKFALGGFEADSGLTGRKIVVDTYQGFARHGGGNMNGKDPTKIDLSASYKARDIAKRLLIANKLKWCEVQLSYVIGGGKPLAIYITSDRGVIVPDESLFDECTPARMISDLKLREPQYENKASFGHF